MVVSALRRSVQLEPSVDYLLCPVKFPAFQESHRRGEILVAAMMRAFLNIWTSRLASLGYRGGPYLSRERVAEEAADAADYLLTMAIRALDYTPPIDIAHNIAEVCEGRLDAIVATHRHQDHISGFAGETGKIIVGLLPQVVIQPWTEDPKAAVDATHPTPQARHRLALAGMHEVAACALEEISRNGHGFTKTVCDQLTFLGEDNLSNAEAVKNLMDMQCQHVYAHYGRRSGLEKILPGVTTHVLRPPTLEQSQEIRYQCDEDADEFWHLQALSRQPGAR